jgi:hypothetical protein
METIAVTKDQAKALLAEAKKRAKKTKVEGGYQAYFKHVRGAVPSVTDNKTSCADHRLVRVVCGLRECAGIVHKSLGKVHFAPRTALARKHPRGVACFMPLKRGRDFISDHHRDMARRTRPAPEGFGADTIESRREDIEAGSVRQILTFARDEAKDDVIFWEEFVEEEASELVNAINRYMLLRDRPNAHEWENTIKPHIKQLHDILKGCKDDWAIFDAANASLAAL